MFIIFGWLKEGVFKESILSTYCYHCNSISSWGLYTETEWVTFFEIKTIPFLRKHSLSCERCHDLIPLSNQYGRKIYNLYTLNERQKSRLHEEVVAMLERHQLAGKTERQMKYIRSMKQTHDDNNS